MLGGLESKERGDERFGLTHHQLLGLEASLVAVSIIEGKLKRFRISLFVTYQEVLDALLRVRIGACLIRLN